MDEVRTAGQAAASELSVSLWVPVTSEVFSPPSLCHGSNWLFFHSMLKYLFLGILRRSGDVLM